MHHKIFSAQDAYITNEVGQSNRNFGIDEILQVGTSNREVRTLSQTKDYVYVNAVFNRQSVEFFTGIFTGSLCGTVRYATGSISGSNIAFSSSYFTGSVDGVDSGGSGSFSGSLVFGNIQGNIIAPSTIGEFTGILTGSSGAISGIASGTDTRNQPNWTTAYTQFVNRSLLKFDLTAISTSIANGTIINPSFHLQIKVCNEFELPITYAIYAFPISQSWEMGNGYFSDGGSEEGVNWIYRDNNGETLWYSPFASGSRPTWNFISNPSLLTASFAYGGGTFYASPLCSQNYTYETSDIDMDVSTIVNGWLNGSIPNEGFILLSSDELSPTGSGFTLKFFSKDTNTIYSPCLDVAWDDWSFVTGSISTGSVYITTASAGIRAIVQSGSTFNIDGGISGSFSASAFIIPSVNYITANQQIFNYSAANVISNDTWYANNGYHYDTWQTAWQLDPYSGGFLPNTDITAPLLAPDYGSPPVIKFTGSFTGSFSGTASYTSGSIYGSGQFSASYFTGSVNGVPQISISSSISGSLIDGFIVGKVESVSQLGLYIGQLTSPLIYLNGTGSGNYMDSTYVAIDGFVDGKGLSGNILGIPIIGSVQGLTTIGQTLVTGPCGKSFSASLAKAIFVDGPFSSSAFTAYYVDHKFENAILTGSWIPSILLGSSIYIHIPSGMDPYAYATVTGTYINGTVLGIYILSGSTSASFNGQFTSGNFLGGFLSLQLSGSVYTSDYSYTSSVSMTSSMLYPLDIQRPFNITLQNVYPAYKAGDIIKIGVFGRKQYPLKYFGISTQQEQYLIPEYLPSSSYYALKDNQTEEIVIDFDNFTKIGCEYPGGNYFIIDTTSLPQDRYYRVLIRVVDEQSTYTIDTGKIFKLTR